MRALAKNPNDGRVSLAQVLVASPGKGMQAERIRLASELWAADVAAEFGYKANPNFKDSLQQADDAGTPFVLVLGESELKEVPPQTPKYTLRN